MAKAQALNIGDAIRFTHEIIKTQTRTPFYKRVAISDGPKEMKVLRLCSTRSTIECDKEPFTGVFFYLVVSPSIHVEWEMNVWIKDATLASHID
jgi:hypothetical protein